MAAKSGSAGGDQLRHPEPPRDGDKLQPVPEGDEQGEHGVGAGQVESEVASRSAEGRGTQGWSRRSVVGAVVRAASVALGWFGVVSAHRVAMPPAQVLSVASIAVRAGARPVEPSSRCPMLLVHRLACRSADIPRSDEVIGSRIGTTV